MESHEKWTKDKWVHCWQKYVQWQSLEPSRAVHSHQHNASSTATSWRVVTLVNMTSWVTQQPVACISSWRPSLTPHHAMTERDGPPPELIDHCVAEKPVQCTAGSRRDARGRDSGPSQVAVRRLQFTTYKTCPLASGRHSYCTSSSAMKSSVLIVIAVLVASTYASYVGPYRHYYVPGFQHTYVLQGGSKVRPQLWLLTSLTR